MIDKQTRKEKKVQVSETIREYYESMDWVEALQNVMQNLNVTPEVRGKVTFIVGDTILGFYEVSNLPEVLQENSGITDVQAQQITTDMIEVLSPVIDIQNKKKKDLTELADTIGRRDGAAPQLDTPQTQSEPQQGGSVQKVRTMERDINRIHGYGAQTQPHADEPVIKALSQEETFAPATPPAGTEQPEADVPVTTEQAVNTFRSDVGDGKQQEPPAQQSTPSPEVTPTNTENYQRIPIKRNTNWDTPQDD